MITISLKVLLEAGCHFGHKVERWHPKASTFIYGAKEGVHIIDLARTKSSLEVALSYITELTKQGKILLLVGTKRQARGVVNEAAKRGNIFYMTNRWVGGFLTNWEEVKKNIDKLNKMVKESGDGSWSQFPKHERVQLEKEMRKLERVYGGVATLTNVPDAIYVVDIKKERNVVLEAKRRGISIVAIVDTNSDPTNVDYPIPANDDAVGSIKCITDYVVDAYMEGAKLAEKKGVVKEMIGGEALRPIRQAQGRQVQDEKKAVEKVKPVEKAIEKVEKSAKKAKKDDGAEKTKSSDEINAVDEEKEVLRQAQDKKKTPEKLPQLKKTRGRPKKEK